MQKLSMVAGVYALLSAAYGVLDNYANFGVSVVGLKERKYVFNRLNEV